MVLSSSLFGNSSGSVTSTLNSEASRETFKALKEICVPLLSNSLLTVESIPRVSRLLSQLLSSINALSKSQHIRSPDTITYVFYPLSHILQRNPVSAIPDVIMEKILDVISVLFEQWWWSCPVEVWEQVLMLSAAIIGGVDGSDNSKGKTKDRDDETKRAAAQCLWSVLRRRDESENTMAEADSSIARARFTEFQARGRAPKLLPILGKTLTSLLEVTQSFNRDLQTTALRIVQAMIDDYLPAAFMPSILPGVISAMIKAAVGRREGKGWSNGDTVTLALQAMEKTIVRSIGDDVCQSEGAIRIISGLEDLASSSECNDTSRPVETPPQSSPFFTPRTSAWLSASASQLHIALNTLSPLMSHPSPVALMALSNFSQVVASNTTQTLPDTQPLLLSFLLSLSTSSFPNVAEVSHGHLLTLLTPPSTSRFTLLRLLIRVTQENLSAIPRLLPSHSDSKVEHSARQVIAVCHLAKDVPAVSDGLDKLLGPSGGIEKWGLGLLSVLELVEPPLFVSTVQAPRALLEGGPESAATHPFPAIQLKYVTSLNTQEELDRMFRALGAASGFECLFSVEWFVNVARRGRSKREVAALWCACKILEGVGGVSADGTVGVRQPAKRVEKVARWIAKIIAELWDQEERNEDGYVAPNEDTAVNNPENDSHLPLQYTKGLDPIITRFDLKNGDNAFRSSSSQSQRTLHSVLALQLLAATSAILGNKFSRLLLHTLYPVLRSLVSENSYLSATALAALHQITATTAYASPSNLLLANFDYALDGVARRLDRRHLDPEATKILVVLVRLVGKDIVSRAGDVVEACFDRLDEFHGYNALVEGLVEVLMEVVQVVESDGDEVEDMADEASSKEREDRMEALLQWYQHRNDQSEENEEDYGPAPRSAWKPTPGKGKEKELNEEQTTPPSNTADANQEPPPSPTQALIQQIVARSIYFLTHPSPLIRTRILSLLDSACSTISTSNFLPSIHTAWPYILNRLADSEPFVVSTAASLVASLAEHVGEFMTLRIWDDVWPRFRTILAKLEAADSHSALARRGVASVGTESAYSHSHRLYTSLLRTMRAVVGGVQLRHDILWDILMAFRRFLHIGAHEELQLRARDVYTALTEDNADAVWLVLAGSIGKDALGARNGELSSVSFLAENNWDIEANAKVVLGLL